VPVRRTKIIVDPFSQYDRQLQEFGRGSLKVLNELEVRGLQQIL